MYIEIKCRSCGKSFCVDFSSNEYDVDRCPKCGVHLSSSDVSRIRAITEPLYINVNKLNSVNVFTWRKTVLPELQRWLMIYSYLTWSI